MKPNTGGKHKIYRVTITSLLQLRALLKGETLKLKTIPADYRNQPANVEINVKLDDNESQALEAFQQKDNK